MGRGRPAREPGAKILHVLQGALTSKRGQIAIYPTHLKPALSSTHRFRM